MPIMAFAVNPNTGELLVGTNGMGLHRRPFSQPSVVGTEAADTWAGWDEAPFAILLVTEDHEFLVRHPRPSADFEPIGYDNLQQAALHSTRFQFPRCRGCNDEDDHPP